MFILYALAHPLRSSETSVLLNNTFASADGNATDGCGDIGSCRTVEGIIYSCIAVVFVCTWVAIHPNIPRKFVINEEEKREEYRETGAVHSAVVTLRNVLIMLLALIAPELIILWAIQQWSAARQIAKDYEKYSWTQTHGFFVIMGGFVVHNGKEYLGTLTFRPEDKWTRWMGDGNFNIKDSRGQAIATAIAFNRGATLSFHRGLENEIRYTFRWHNGKKENTAPDSLLVLLIQTGLISITEDEIMDRSKSDPLAKIIVVCQTLWFITQCVARGVERLSITDLEILTTAFAVFNFVTYFLWWNKPQRVRFPIIIDASDAQEQEQEQEEQEDTRLLNESTQEQSCKEAARPEESMLEQARTEQTTTEVGRTGDLEARRGDSHGVTPGILNGQNHMKIGGRIWFKAIGQEIEDDWKSIFGNSNIPQWFIIRAFLYPFFTIFIQLGQLLRGDIHYQTGYEDSDDSGNKLGVFVFVISVLFGGIHCIPWAFQFPSHVEQILWRVCALLVTCIPIGIGLVAVAPHFDMEGMLILLLPILYIGARIILIVLALMELRALPSSAYQTVEWTTLIPHI